MSQGMPIIRFEVEGMRATLLQALTKYQAEMDTQIHAAVEELCKPENLEPCIYKVVQRALKAAVEEELEKFFQYGEGRLIVRDAVRNKMLNNKDSK